VQHRWYGPDENWPAHPKSWWKEALAEARSARWYLQIFSDHGWGKVVCSRAIDGPCEKVIFSTGRSGENHARDLARLVRRCRHPRDDQLSALARRLAEAGRLLDGAAQLLDAAESWLAADADAAAVEDLLDKAQDTMAAAESLLAADADDLLNHAIELDGLAQARRIDSWTRAVAAGYPPAQTPTASDLAAEAEQRIDAAAGAVDEALGMAGVEQLRSRVQDLRNRVEAIRSAAAGVSTE
jgi:hypothetical protein